MTTNFFDDLERQLVAATPQRATRLRRARIRRMAALSTILLALLAGGAGIAAAVDGGAGDGSDDPGAPAGATTPTTTTVALSARTGAIPFHNTVAVLNATPVPGLARGVANRLQNAKVKIGNVTNAADQTRASTGVTYVPGHEDAALRVAALLDLSPSVISPATKADRTIAGEEAAVIVLVGSDQNLALKHTPHTTKSP
jgi:hypothetical protein